MRTCHVPNCGKRYYARRSCQAHYAKFKREGNLPPRLDPQTPEQRFWEKVDKSGDCWTWTAATNQYGYGVFRASHKELPRASVFVRA